MNKAFLFNLGLGVYLFLVSILGFIINYYDVKIQSWIELKKKATLEDFLVQGNRFFSFSRYRLDEIPPEMHSYAKKHAAVWQTVKILSATFLIFALCMLFSLP